MFLSALSVLGEERGEPRWAWFLGTWKISSRVKILPGLWHNMTEVFEWSVGSCLLSRSFFSPSSPSPLYPFHPARPRPPFLIPSFFFERHYTTVLTFSRCRVRTGIDLCPHKWKREGVLFLLSSGSYSMERYRVPSLWYHAFVSITSNFLFYNAKERLGNRREYAFELVSRRFAILYIVIVGYTPPFYVFDYQATIMNCCVSRSVFDSIFYSIFADNR